MDLNEVVVFIKVIESGSFSRAAEQLGMPKSTVSTKVSNLERRLGVTLIKRSTRKLSITPVGQEYYSRVTKSFSEINAAESELLASQREPQGLLRVTAPVELGNTVMPEIAPVYLKKYPKVQLDVLLTDRKVDFLSENIDLAIRAGALKDSSLIARKIGESNFGIFASPAYIKKSGAPSQPKELVKYDCIHFSALPNDEWKLENGKSTATVSMQGKLIVNDLALAKRFACSEMGLALLPAFFCRTDIEAGRLVRVLPEWGTVKTPLHFVYPAQKFVQPNLTAFIKVAIDDVRIGEITKA